MSKIRSSAFSLIELLIVIAIIAIITTIALPLFQDYRSRANDASAKTDVRNSIALILSNKS
ncbi:prepilin-type N-terminal cleavage/methylation domain-containing protein [Pseudomonas sp.]|uniref:prepilin-type N-terminal cleavage/methylation domain-containing protein n=1 Tax=Pseudomonas sp. TaxID=306 RepID=UPI0028B02CD1|nr:prepilin-type N-terminal cleavage/methylation domain-containing protein [Pseudomonas sp.]